MASYNKNLAAVVEHLDEGETIIESCDGTYEVKVPSPSLSNGAIIVTEHRVVFFGKKTFSGYDMQTFPLSKISAIEMSKGFLGKSISLKMEGNSANVKWIQKGHPEAVVKYVRDHIGETTAVPAADDIKDAADDIKDAADDIKDMADDIEKFDVVLQSEGPRKVAVVAAVIKLTGRGLKEAKEIVDGAPGTLKEGVSEAEATAFKTQLEQAGARVHVRLNKIWEAENARKQALEKEDEANKKQALKEKENARVKSLYQGQLKEFDKDGNGQVDVVESDDFQSLLNMNQTKIIEINRDYVQQFVQVSVYLKTKRGLIQRVFELIGEVLGKGEEKVESIYDLDLAQFGGEKLKAVEYVKETLGIGLKEAKDAVDAYYAKADYAVGGIIPINEATAQSYVDTLKDEIHLYNLLLVHAFAMVEALVQDNMVLFYEIHQKFDDLNVFDSKHQRDVTTSLHNINVRVNQLNVSLGKVTQAIHDLGNDIVFAIGDLSSITQESARLVESALGSVNSSIQANNLISSVQIYQLHRISKNTKSLRG